MPNTKSAKKRLKQNVEKRDHNRSIRSSIRTQLRKVREAIAAGDVQKSQEEFRLATKKLDQATSKNIYHKNTTARIKSRLSTRIKNLKNPPAAE